VQHLKHENQKQDDQGQWYADHPKQKSFEHLRFSLTALRVRLFIEGNKSHGAVLVPLLGKAGAQRTKKGAGASHDTPAPDMVAANAIMGWHCTFIERL
jgi:hypothetical protein